MRLPFAVLPLLATLSPFALADVEFTSPSAGGTLPAGSLKISWSDGSGSPSLSTLKSYKLDLVLGSNTAGSSQAIYNIVPNGDFADGNSATGKIDPTVAASTKNGYFFQITSTSSDGGSVINYSDRFTVSGMTGTTPPLMAKAIDGSTKGPTAVNNMVAADPAGAVPAAGDYGIPYNKQSGSIRYAPMQPFPPTKITKKGPPTPQFPTSAFTIATGKMGPPNVISTMTESQTHKAMTMENTVKPQAHPKDDMAKFLARWKD